MAVWGPENINAGGDAANDMYTENGAIQASACFFGNSGGANLYATGLRFVGVDVPQGATINDAHLRMIARNLTGTITNIHAKVRGHKGDAPAFSDGVFDTDSGVTLTTAGIDFDPTTFVQDVTIYDVTITTVVQEIVNATWASGDDMALFVFDDGSSAGEFLRIWDFADGDSSELEIDYTAAAAGGPARRTITLLGVGQ